MDPKKLADNLVRTWLKGTGLNKLLKVKSTPLLDLREEIAAAVRIAYEKGQRSRGPALREAEASLEALRKEKSAEGQAGNMLVALGRLRGILGAHKGGRQGQGGTSRASSMLLRGSSTRTRPPIGGSHAREDSRPAWGGVMGICYCSVIDGRQFLCGGCAQKLNDELEALKDDHTDLKEANKALQDQVGRLQNTIEALTKGKEARTS